MKVSMRIRYGYRAMAALASLSRDSAVALDVIAKVEHIPERYLANIFQDLRKAGLVSSVRGPGGGYVLSKPKAEINLLDIWIALEGRFNPAECVQTTHQCPSREDCAMHDVWEELQLAFEESLRLVNLEYLSREHRTASA